MRKVWVAAGAGLMCALPLWAGGADPGARSSTGAGVGAGAGGVAGNGNPLAAVWREQRLDFFYMGRTSRYSCDGLRDKMRALLLDLGARRDLKVSAIGCDESAPRLAGGPAGPNLRIIFSSPALPEATLKPLHAGDLAPVDARYQPFTLASDAFRNFGIGDCELVEEFARQVLPKFVTRNVTKDITCVPYQSSGSRFFVRGETLRAGARP
ncbi:MAG TPA: hypothetical protein VNY80_11490 [Steroidobacteraceae bacterium]|jgi:hypothetical protein|nr:hypothetical protein [Steroidobacteraceae bacterium]